MEMTPHLIARVVKLALVVLFAGGAFAAVMSRSRAARMRGLWVSTIGFVGAWGAGYLLLKLTGRSMGEAWISWSMVASLGALHMAAILAHKAQPRRVTGLLTLACLLTSALVMVPRSSDLVHLGLMSVGALALSVPVAFWMSPDPSTLDAPEPADSWAWFRWVARFEGASLILLLLIFMPLKYGAGIIIDGGTGALGWLHGVLFVVYIQALWSTSRMLGWSWRQRIEGFVWSLIPFGAFIFERRIRSATPDGAEA